MLRHTRGIGVQAGCRDSLKDRHLVFFYRQIFRHLTKFFLIYLGFVFNYCRTPLICHHFVQIEIIPPELPGTFWPKKKLPPNLDIEIGNFIPSEREDIVAPDHAPELPEEIVSIIANLIPSSVFAAFSGVCKAWRSVSLNIKWKPGHRIPCLLVSADTEHNHKQKIFNLYRNKLYELELPHVSGKRCFGSPHGWIVTITSDLEQAHLINLVSQVQVNLPHLNTIRDQMGLLVSPYIHKCILLKIIAEVDDENQFLVVVIFGENHCLAFAKPRSVQWTIIGGLEGVKDMALYKGQLYAIFRDGRLLSFASADLESTQRTPFEQRYGTNRFKVYIFQADINGNGGTWQRLDHLGDRALFVGEGNSWSVTTTNDLNCRQSCIYFTDDNWDQNGRGGSHDSDIGLYDIVSNRIGRLEFGSHSPSDHSSRTIIMAADPFISKYILFKKDETFVVVVIFGPNYCLPFAKPESVQWKIVEGLEGVKDLVLYKGQLYAIFGQGRLQRFESVWKQG
ncbi:hypothetical protein CCACVL1_19935 [Corchorus capsularis]|uniref:KIB1-4 beta-propeller domain-containing protein n=1 Tax=Corchorus capsularis TaxID=210143 RepID=A0A1R3HDS8_COCAP|nr:hypothetical protein CCACVL1_19935 [Corchorus capsularis]